MVIIPSEVQVFSINCVYHIHLHVAPMNESNGFFPLPDTVSRSHVNNQCPNYNPSLKRGVHLPAAASALRKHFSSSSSAWLQSIGTFASCVEGYFGSGSLWGFGVQVDHKFMVTKGRVCRMYCFLGILLHPTVSTCEWEEHGFKFHRCFQPKPSNKLGQSIQLTQTDWSFDQLDMG